MTFFRMLKVDFKRMFLSKRFYISTVIIFLLLLISIWPEIQSSGFTASIFYLVKVRGGIGAFLLAMSIVITLPFGLSYWEDERNNYFYSIGVRTGRGVYCWSHTITTAVSSFLSVFLGYSLCFVILSFRLSLLTEAEVESIAYSLNSNGDLNIGDRLAYDGNPISAVILIIATEALGYAFMAVFTLMVSVKIKNVYLLLSMPILLYYGSAFIGTFVPVPPLTRWYAVMKGTVILSNRALTPALAALCIVGYFGGLICIEGIVFWILEKGKRKNG